MLKLIAKQDTFLKKSTAHSSLLSEGSKIEAALGDVLVAERITIKEKDSHKQVKLANGVGDWWLYPPHWGIVWLEEEDDSIDWNDPKAKISEYFTVGEATNYSRERIPQTQEVKDNIVKLAKELDRVREAWGSPIIVTSWNRPLAINRRIGSGDRSQHVKGKAADITPTEGRIWEFQKWIDARWYGALGYGAKKGFVHLDNRNGKGFQTSGAKGVRWNY